MVRPEIHLIAQVDMSFSLVRFVYIRNLGPEIVNFLEKKPPVERILLPPDKNHGETARLGWRPSSDDKPN